MNYTILPYTKIIIPAHGKAPSKTIHAPILDTFLFTKNTQTGFSFRSLVDSGADFCVFPAKFGSLMGINIDKGKKIVTAGIGGNETLYFHDIEVGIVVKDEMWKFECQVGFSHKMDPKGTGLLGRNGFFDLFKEVSFNQQKAMFKLDGEGTRNLYQ